MPRQKGRPSRQGAQQNVSAAQSAARNAAASMGMASQVDAPVDFSQGIPVGPPQQAVPNTPPPPPAGEQIQHPGSQPPPGASSLPIPPDLMAQIHAEEAQRAQQGMPPQAPPQQAPPQAPPGYPPQGYPQQQSVPTQVTQQPPAQPKRDHPLLADLKRELGLRSEQYEDFEVGGHLWKMSALSAGDAAMAARVADSLSGSPTEYNVRLNIAMACLAVVAIDDVPAFEVFGVTVPPTILVEDPLAPPQQIRLQAFFHLYDWVINDTKGGLGNRLWDIYSEEIDDKSFVSSYMDNRDKDIVTFKCPSQGCTHELSTAPEYEDGNMKPPFCQHHGVLMQPVESVNPDRDGGNVPLP